MFSLPYSSSCLPVRDWHALRLALKWVSRCLRPTAHPLRQNRVLMHHRHRLSQKLFCVRGRLMPRGTKRANLTTTAPRQAAHGWSLIPTSANLLLSATISPFSSMRQRVQPPLRRASRVHGQLFAQVDRCESARCRLNLIAAAAAQLERWGPDARTCRPVPTDLFVLGLGGTLVSHEQHHVDAA